MPGRQSKLVLRLPWRVNPYVVRSFHIIYKGLVGVFIAGILWALWASAQSNPGSPIIEFGKGLFTVRENAGNATVSVRRSGNTNIASTVQFTTREGTARDGIDFSGKSTQLVFTPGETEQTVSVPVIDNRETDGSRRLRIQLQNPSGATLGALASAEVEIQDDDSPHSAWVTFGLNQVDSLQRIWFGVPLWQYLASIIYVFLAFWVSRFLDFLVRNRLRRWAERTTTKWDDLLLEVLRGPIKVVVFVILLHIGLRIFSWPDWTESFLSKTLKIVVALSLTYMGLKLVDIASRFWSHRAADESDRSFNDQLLPIIRNTLRVFVIIVATLLTLQNLDFNINSLIASVSIGGLALSLAAQDTLSNFFGAIAVLVDKPFRIGEQVKFEGVEGTVEYIGFRSTRVRSFDGFLVSVPNKTVGNATITNMSKRAKIRTLVDIGLAYNTSSEKVQRALDVLKEIFHNHPMTDDLLIGFNRFTDSSLNIFVVHWWKNNDYKAYLAGLERINLEIKQRFDKERIAFAFPTRTVYLQNDGRQPQALESQL